MQLLACIQLWLNCLLFICATVDVELLLIYYEQLCINSAINLYQGIMHSWSRMKHSLRLTHIGHIKKTGSLDAIV